MFLSWSHSQNLLPFSAAEFRKFEARNLDKALACSRHLTWPWALGTGSRHWEWALGPEQGALSWPLPFQMPRVIMWGLSLYCCDSHRCYTVEQRLISAAITTSAAVSVLRALVVAPPADLHNRANHAVHLVATRRLY